MRRLAVTAFCALSMIPMAALAASDAPLVLAVVAPLDLPGDDISVRDLRDLYLGRSERLGGLQVLPVNLSGRTPARKLFSDSVLSMSLLRYKQHWLKSQVYREASGAVAASKPKVYKTGKSVLVLIRKHGNRVGYMPWSVELQTLAASGKYGFKILRVGGKAPGDEGYAIQR